MADQIFHEGSHSSREIIRQRVFSDSLDMDQYGCRRLRITRSGRAISICESNLDASALEPPCQNGNTREQPRRRQFHVRIIVHMKPCRAIHGVARRLRQRLFSRPEQPDWSSHRVPITREFAGTPAASPTSPPTSAPGSRTHRSRTPGPSSTPRPAT